MKLFNKHDFILIVSLLLTALLIFLMFSFFNRNAAFKAHITISGSLAKTADINADAIFSMPEKPNVVFEVKNGAIAFISSDCPDKICVHTGFIKHGGQFAACLPNGVVLRIMGADGVDAVAS
jgi:hypothetical protein